MNDEIFFDGVKYVSASDAGDQSGLSRDYIARLCKEGRIAGRRVGKLWYVNADSLQQFGVEQERARANRRAELSQQRVNEYHRAAPAVHTTAATPILAAMNIPEDIKHRSNTRHIFEEALNKGSTAIRQQTARLASHVPLAHAVRSAPVHVIAPGVELFHKLVAGSVAVLFILGTYAFVDAEYSRFALQSTPKESKIDSAARQFAAAAQDPSNAFESFARSINTRVNSFVYKIAFPNMLTQLAFFSDEETPAVSVRVVPARTAAATSTVVRTVEIERIISTGGLSESLLNAKLAQLDAKLSAQILGVASLALKSTAPVVYNSFHDSGRIFPAHWDPKLRIPRGQVVAAASIVSPKY